MVQPDRMRIIFANGRHMARVVLGYHSALVGARLSEMLVELDEVDLTGVVFESGTLVRTLERLAPDIAVLDIRLLLAAEFGERTLKTRFPSTQFILLYDYPSSQYSRECKRFGAEHCFDTLNQFGDIAAVIAEYNRINSRRTKGAKPS